MTRDGVTADPFGKHHGVWRSTETKHVSIRPRTGREIAHDLERETHHAIATGCRRLVIRLHGYHGSDAAVASALSAVGELMDASGGELIVCRSSRALEHKTPAVTSPAGRVQAQPDVPIKWAT